MDVPTGWVQILRGPRPPAARWPPAQSVPRNVGSQGPQVLRSGSGSGPKPPKPQPTGPRKTPQESRAEAQARVSRLQTAIAALDPEDIDAMESLSKALKKAQAQAKIPPWKAEIEACKQYIERVRKRIAKADEAIVQAQVAKAEDEAEVVKAEQRLERLQSESTEEVPSEQSGRCDLQRQIDELTRERDALSRLVNSGQKPQGRPRKQGVIPAMPGSVPGELAQWLEDRQAELQEALSNDDSARLLDLTSKLAKGAERWVQMHQSSRPDDELALRSEQIRGVEGT